MSGLTALPVEVSTLAPWSAAGLVDHTDVHLAATIARLGRDTRPEVVLGAALAARAPRHGHVCVDLLRIADTVVAERGDAERGDAERGGGVHHGAAPLGDDRAADHTGADDPLSMLPWPDPVRWARLLASSPLVATAGDLVGRSRAVDDGRPLVLDGTRLYLARWWHDEQYVAARLLALAATVRSHPAGIDSAGIDDVDAELDRWFPGLNRSFPGELGDDEAPGEPGHPDHGQPDDPQRAAARSMLTRRLTVVAGGPGTGKTRTIARVLALLHARGTVPSVALAAPTGKAAARMAEAVAAQLTEAGCDDATVASLLDACRPVTLHRLLGVGSRRRRPTLGHDLVVVDEASMVSLELVTALLRALPEHAALVLVGDPDQLTSVETGTVLADVVHAAAAPDALLGGSVVTLQRPYRFGAGSAIARVADAVRRGDVDELLGALHDDEASFVEQLDPLGTADGAGVRDIVLPDAAASVRAALRGDARAALDAHRRVCLLCAHRRGPYGVQAWNRRVEDWLRDEVPGFEPQQTWHVGRPVLITRNDPITGLANGDAGVVVRTPAAPGTLAPLDARDALGSPGTLAPLGTRDALGSLGPLAQLEEGSGDRRRVAVDTGGLRLLRPVQLPDHETFHALTIHKSQGSEYDTVVLVLPPARSRLASRELIYTAVTRARRRLVVVGTRQALAIAVERRVQRASGLVDAIARLAAAR